MRKFRTAAALALCAICLLQTAAPVLAAEDYPAPDVSGKTVEELIDAFRAEHDLTEDNFELSYHNTVTGEDSTMELSGSNVLRYELEDGTSFIIRPSGTEPKIKVYILCSDATQAAADEKVAKYAAFAETIKD